VLGQVGALVGAVPGDLGLLADQLELVGQGQRVVGADLGAEPVLQRRDDPAPVGVVLGVGAGHQHDVERQPQRVAADPDVPLLEHVEQRDLDALGQVGQFVEGEDAAVGPRHQAEVNGLRVAQRAALRHFDRVDVTDQVAHAGVGRRQLLAVAVGLVPPRDGELVAQLRREPAAAGADRHVGMVVDLAAGDDRRPFVEQPHEGADQPRLPLAALPEQDDVVSGEQRALDVGEHRLVEADDAGKPVLPGAHPRQEVLSDLLLDGAVGVAARLQAAQGGRPAVRSACAEFLAAVLHSSDTMSA
jgi:hypothetical protein